jgi:hypothetical protein
MVRFNRVYLDDAELARRFEIWLSHDAEYQRINEDPTNTFLVGHNEFSDWRKEEFDSFLSQPMSVRTTLA